VKLAIASLFPVGKTVVPIEHINLLPASPRRAV